MTYRVVVLALALTACTSGAPAPTAAPTPPSASTPASVHPTLPTPLPPVPPEPTGQRMEVAVPPPVAEFFLAAHQRMYLAARALAPEGYDEAAIKELVRRGSAVTARLRPGPGAYWAVTLTVRGRPLRHWPACTFYVAHDHTRVVEITSCPAPEATPSRG